MDWKKYNNHNRIFNNTKGSFLTPSKPRRWFRSIIKNTELEPIPIHGFRHTHASLLFEAGASIKEVQKRLGHSKASVTMEVYTHVTKEARDTFAEKFANYIDF